MFIKQAKEVLKIEADSILDLTEKIDHNFTQMIDCIIASDGRVVISGIGKSGLIGQKVVATLNSTGTQSFFLHPVEALHGDLGLVSSGDVFLGLSYSGETTELNSLLPNIKKLGCPIIALTGNHKSTLAKKSDITIDVSVKREACPMGLAPTSSTTALLAMGDALAVVLMNKKKFKTSDFKKNHPGGNLGQRLSKNVSDLMVTNSGIPVVQSGTSLRESIEKMDHHCLGTVIIENPVHKILGIFTDGDIRRLVSRGSINQEVSIDSVMIGDPKCIHETSPVYDALNLMEEFQITILPVLDQNNSLTGILELHDILGKGEFKFS